MSERKYRQRGYMDDEPRERRPRPRPAAKPSGPRGRGLGRPTATVCRCAVCNAELDARAITAESKCHKCGADLHTCTHCVHFDTTAPRECRREIPERIAGKAKANRCPLFEPRTTREFAADRDTPASAKSAFDALFKDL